MGGCDRDWFIEEVAAGILAEIPPDAIRKVWFDNTAKALNISLDMLRKYARQEHECSGSAFLRMCQHWPAFRARFFGTAPASAADDMLDDIEEILARRRAT